MLCLPRHPAVHLPNGQCAAVCAAFIGDTQPRRNRGQFGLSPQLDADTMIIAKDTAVTLAYSVTNAQGQLVDDGKSALAYLHGGYDNIFPKIEAALEGQTIGYQGVVALSPAEAFGERDESLVQTMPKADFPPGVKVGGQIQRVGPDGQPQYFFVTKIKGPIVLLDGNHPLAGQSLRFKFKVLAVRAATEEEIAHKHVHGEHGHHH